MSERLVVAIGAIKPNYKAATLPSGKTVFVRKSTMRHGPAAWAELAAGDEVELAFKVCAGREIITDAVKLPASGWERKSEPEPEPEQQPASIYEDDDVIARPSRIEGIGLFAKRRFEAGEVVLTWTPHVLTEDQFQSAGTTA